MTQPKTSLLSIFALIFSFLCFPLGLLLGVLAIVKINKADGALGGKGLAIAAIVISAGVVLPGTGCLAAIAVPNFVKFQCRAKQAEAKVNLRSLFVAQESYRAEHETYGTSLDVIGFQPSGGQVLRYEVVITSADKDRFEAKATSAENGNDTWTINETRELMNVVAGCG